jgi:hypothetical protein
MNFLVDALTWLGLAAGLTHSSVVYALVSATHILGIALLLGAVVLVDLSLLGRITRPDSTTFELLRRTAKTGVTLAVVTGVLLLSARPHEYLVKPVVWAKLVLIALAIANAFAFEHRAARGNATTAGRLHAALSLSLWLGVLLLGRWIAFA